LLKKWQWSTKSPLITEFPKIITVIIIITPVADQTFTSFKQYKIFGTIKGISDPTFVAGLNNHFVFNP
jgi:hypothetical protein